MFKTTSSLLNLPTAPQDSIPLSPNTSSTPLAQEASYHFPPLTLAPSLDLSPNKGKERASSPPIHRSTSLPQIVTATPTEWTSTSTSKLKAATTTTRELNSDSSSQSQSDTDSNSNSGKPEPPSMTATEFEREVYKRALAEWEESHGFIKRFAERQAGGRLLSVNDEKYRKLVEEFRAAQKMGSTSAAAGSDSGVQSVVAVKKEEKSGSRWFGGLKRKMRGVVRT